MRKNQLTAIVAIILLAVTVKVFFFAQTAKANVDTIKGLGLDVTRMHENKTLPVQAVYDMSFVYSQEY